MKSIIGRVFGGSKIKKLRKPSLKETGTFIMWSGVIGAILFFAFFIYIQQTLPDPSSIANRKVSESTKIYDRTGKVLLYDIHGEEKRTIIPWEKIPANLKNATLAAEDSGFYSHGGFDVKGIIRSLYKDVTSFSLSQGGSTITQQLVKQTLLGSEKTALRKIKELVLSIELERNFSKDQIFWMYLNQIPYGSNAYGIQAASKAFFNKDVDQLTLSEAATLASLPQAPSYYSPYGNHVDSLMARRNSILANMKKLGSITEEEYKQALSDKPVFHSSMESITAPHFVIMVKDYLANKYGEDAIESGGFNVITTLDANLQDYAEEAVAKYSAINKTKYKASNAALVAISPKSGDVLALVGSSDYFDLPNQGNFNVITAERQPGSSFKPFAYAAAFQKGYPDSTILFDLKTEFNPSCSPDASQNKDQYGLACYHPRNYDGLFRGPVTLRQALDQSLNIPSVKTLYLAGIPDTINLAQQMGITTLTEPERYGLSLVLGGAEVKPIDLASAYGVFANDGIRNPYRIIQRVEDVSGNILEQAQDQSERVLDSQTARLMNNVLSDNSARASVFGYNNSLYIPGYSVGAKTGTTQDNRDGWVAGFSPSISTVVWTGNNNNTSMTAAGAGISAAGPMWNEFMSKALATFPHESFSDPNPVSSSKPMLNGSSAYTPQDGGPVQYHEILYYVDRSDPQGPTPSNPSSDPQYTNWDWPVLQTYSQSEIPASGSLSPTPTP
ncbi:MAG: PBP1A family penicillin-binding protein [Candidatus Pacebacteria bacterium]|nr:PBP1A family penicillin-binding protein [Candidatus Paceibacterota bacterium]